ncbi:helix-turn-helix transcriptional regulator [Mycolicibacterium chubuense]|uniref:CsgBAC operon transcriptional regulatory protein n=1 Tax=Mycolicibacterium chubuense TaxID=1800 RepID=A0A0J6W7F7_MYCCU|nr:LuxR family transcriptional regulator [Mycolicibacterium chubuense]KMO77557.1 CsgBAC operon transcriptional regulatory protein [Mycolicibacterium chubuense]ORA54374.1 helix-turn-helix transcriptional regulator [Mycolicibacterium chubuense]SPX96639.1 response regulator receiver protein [Mycolicibacterium chubuense]
MVIELQTDLLSAARRAHQRRDWRASYEAFELASRQAPLRTDDLDAFAFAAWRLGHIKESSRAAERVFAELTRTDPAAAAMKANELALAWLVRGDLNIGQGWMNRARRLLAGTDETAAHGYLTYLEAAVAAITHDVDGLRARVGAMRELSARLDVPAVTALSLIAAGVEAILQARTAEGYALFDEAILPLVADQVPIEWAGDIYCMVLHHCHKLADLPRMRTWTQSMEQWCGLSGSVPYGGVCDVHRLQVRAATDDYRGLEDRLSRASRALEEVNSWAAAEGYYQLGEVRRLRGDFDGAATAFEQARTLGMDPQPGAALLACRRGDRQGAWTAIRVALAGRDRLTRVRLLRAAVEISLSRDALDEAERYCAELEADAAAFQTPGFRGWAAHARGAVLVRAQQFGRALEALQVALTEYRTQQSRYETAEVYEWMALAHRGLGHADAAAADAATADAIYAQLGVEPAGICGAPSPGGLTRREREVLTLIAAGATNRQVAQQLHLSEKTVSRHLANIYAKAGVSSRTAAVAWARDNAVLP